MRRHPGGRRDRPLRTDRARAGHEWRRRTSVGPRPATLRRCRGDPRRRNQSVGQDHRRGGWLRDRRRTRCRVDHRAPRSADPVIANVRPLIEAAAITFGYSREQPVLNGWSGSVAGGEIVAIVGPSGSGKSTLLYILGTLVRPWSGTLWIGDHDVARVGDRGRSDVRSAAIGFVFQDALLDPRRSVFDNVVEGAVYRGDSRAEAGVQARALLERFGVDVESSRRATDLSGGQAQRIALARALLDSPPIVLADEPTGNLDHINAKLVETALFEHARSGAAIVMATHDEVLAARCDRTFRLS
ncbi:MAG: ATP-binding cassette domain-containing protein [Chloroflexi bacterium]|nr:ATP-binding cassette domain-containing protein [Chloroflexota bacterium]